MVGADGFGERRDGSSVGQVACVPVGHVSGGANGLRAGLDVTPASADEDDGCAGRRKGTGDNLADLAFRTNAGEQDRGSREHERRPKNAWWDPRKPGERSLAQSVLR
jgi:hypothetical protein